MGHYYFDHNATTPVAPEVFAAMTPALTGAFGNSSSIHRYGQEARQAVDAAKRQVAAHFGVKADEIVFTGGGTEADNLAILGTARHGHVVTTTVEHPAVLEAAKQAATVTFVAGDANGWVDPDDVRRAIRPDTKLVSVMHANNELGTIQPIEEIARVAHDAGVLFHSDGVQATGKVAVKLSSPEMANIDLYSISAHKFYGPKGAGALFVREATSLSPIVFGGRHQRGLRPGTENVAGNVGLGVALGLLEEHGEAEGTRLGELRDLLEELVVREIDGVTVNGARGPRVPNTSNLRFDGIDSEPLLIALDLRGFAVSAGAACSSGVTTPSHVLTAIGLSKEQARSSIRVSLGRSNDRAQVEALVGALAESVAHLRRIAPAP